ncbi:hypothetical protein J1614_006872 [Plenodomus biglobosus]|nr:hypothetical protein J1614_006872 [Plenodomus biglobosus]
MKKAIARQHAALVVSKFIIRNYLWDSDDEESLYNEDAFPSDAAAVEHVQGIDRLAPDADIEAMQAWLNSECEKEQARVGPLDFGPGSQNTLAYHDLSANLRTAFSGMDTTLLKRIRRGEGTHDFVPEDLLAPLRLGISRLSDRESYSEMLDVLLAWNTHVSNARTQLLDTLKTRSVAAQRVLDIAKSKEESAMYDEVGQEAILEPSKRNLVKALHAYRPGTAQFVDQDPFSMLVMLWANIGRADPDIKEDHDVQNATLKVLGLEAQLALRFLNAEIRWSVIDSKDAAKKRKDVAEMGRCKERINKFDEEVKNSSLSKTIKGIARARGELRKVVMGEMLELTMLQAALKWAAWESGDQGPASAWDGVVDKCAQADALFERARPLCIDDLEMTVGVVSSTLQGMRTIHDSTLTRAMKIAGEDVAKMDEVAQKRIVEQRKRASVTALTMSETLSGVTEAQRAAREILRHVASMEHSLWGLLKVLRSRYRAYDEFAAVLSPKEGRVSEEQEQWHRDLSN